VFYTTRVRWRRLPLPDEVAMPEETKKWAQ
jgi:hypothetical protein